MIAAINGAAAGGGLALALACDIRLAGASARFNVAFVRLGISGCDIGVSWLLPRLVGASRAWELMLTGRIIGAEEADHIGLVLKVVPDHALLDAALETAGLIAANSPWGVRMTKEVMWSQLEVGSLQAASTSRTGRRSSPARRDITGVLGVGLIVPRSRTQGLIRRRLIQHEFTKAGYL